MGIQGLGARSLKEEIADGGSRERRRGTPAGARSGTWSEAVFKDLYLQYYERVVGVLLRLLGRRTEAEELANEVFLRLYRQRLLPDPDGNVGGWLYRTATNAGIDALRASGRRRQYEEEAGRARLASDQAHDPLDEVLRAEKCHRVRSVLALLRPAQAQVLTLRHSGFSYKELADTLGVAGGSVGTMLARAEAEFERRYLETYGEEEL